MEWNEAFDKILVFMDKKDLKKLDCYLIGHKIMKEFEDSVLNDEELEEELDEFEDEEDENLEEDEEDEAVEEQPKEVEQPKQEETKQEQPKEMIKLTPQNKPSFSKKPPMLKKSPVDDFLTDF